MTAADDARRAGPFPVPEPGKSAHDQGREDDVVVRHPGSRDLDQLPAIEAAGDQMFVDLWGLDGWESTQTGQARAERPGFLLVAARGEEVLGFAQVLEGGDESVRAHLEQMSVCPESAGQGIGTALLEASQSEARRRGHQELTLCTFVHVPWNGPMYLRRGFEPVSVPDEAFYRELVAEEAWLEQYDQRMLMRRAL